MELTEFNDSLNSDVVVITTTLPKKFKELLKENGFRIKDCCIEGARLKFLEKTTNVMTLLKELNELKIKVEMLSKKISTTTMELYQVKDQVVEKK